MSKKTKPKKPLQMLFLYLLHMKNYKTTVQQQNIKAIYKNSKYINSKILLQLRMMSLNCLTVLIQCQILKVIWSI